MIYVEKNPIKFEAFKFTGTITDEMRSKGILEPNSFQINNICNQCGKNLFNHALIGIGDRFQIICPNNYIIFNNKGIQIMSVENFEALYRPIGKGLIEDVDFKEIIS